MRAFPIGNRPCPPIARSEGRGFRLLKPGKADRFNPAVPASSQWYHRFLRRRTAGMNGLLSVLAAVSCAIALVAQSTREDSAAARRERLKAALHEEWEHQLRAYPEVATAVGDNRYNDRLSDYSPEFFAGEVEHARQASKIFEAIDTTGFPEQEGLSRDLMVRGLREQVE